MVINLHSDLSFSNSQQFKQLKYLHLPAVTFDDSRPLGFGNPELTGLK